MILESYNAVIFDFAQIVGGQIVRFQMVRSTTINPANPPSAKPTN